MKSFNKIIGLLMLVVTVLILAAGEAPAAVMAVAPRIITAGTVPGTQGGAAVAIPITIDNPAGVGGIAFTIGYDPAVLQFTGLSAAPAPTGWNINDGTAYQVQTPVNGVAYYNPYTHSPTNDPNYPYTDTTAYPYNTTANATLFFQFNDVKDANNNPVGRVLVSGASAVSLTGTALFNANFSIKGGINSTTYPIKLFPSVINNPAAGYALDTFLPILVGTGDLDTATGKYTTLNFPVIPAAFVAGGITVTAPAFNLGGKVTYFVSGANATGCTVTLQKVTAAGSIFNGQTTVDANGNYVFTGKSAGNYNILVTSLDPTYNDGSLSSVALSADKANADIILQQKLQPVRIKGSVTGYIPGLLAQVVDGQGNVMGVFNIASDGTWSSALLPAGGTYKWNLVYGSLSSGPYLDNATQNFDNSQLKSISGNIAGLNGATGAVTAVSVKGKLKKTVQVTQDGDYPTISNLVPADDYIVSLVATGQPVTYYNINDVHGKTDVSQATKVDVSAGNATGISFSFVPPSGLITGTIIDGSGSTTAGMTVYGFEVNTFALVQATSGTGGVYSLTVKPGTYEIFVIKGNGKIFYHSADGTPVQNESGAALVTAVDQITASGTNINITESDKTLTGKVTYRTATGDPAANVLITVYTDTQRALALTGQDGAYSITGLFNGVAYTVEMKPLAGNYAVQTASITAGTDTTKNFIIDTGAVLSGTVTVSGGTTPVGGAMLFLKDQTTGALVGGRVYFSAANGTYSIGDIQAGSYTLEVTSPDYQSFSVALDINADVTQNVALTKGGYFKGTVTDVTNSNAPLPLNGATIIITSSASGAVPVYTVTNSAGGYSVYGLPLTDVNNNNAVINYIIIAQKRGYERQAKPGKQPATTDTAGNIVDFALAPPVTVFKVSGTVTDTTPAAIPNAIVVVSSKTRNFVGNATTDVNGAYTINGLLPATDYKIVVLPGANLPTQSDSFSVTNLDVTKSFTIQLGGDIGGTITGPSTTARTYVFLYKSTTYVGFTKAVNNAFQFKALPPGNDYHILVVSPGFASQWSGGGSSVDTAGSIASGTTGLLITLQ